MKESWDSELRADAWAGCAIAKSKLTPSRLQAVLLAMSTYPSARQPDWATRRTVITDGYSQCGGKVLPPLAKEKPEQATRGDGRKDDAVTVVAIPGGCAGDKDCRNRRVCLNSRCVAAPERRRCGKDTDCPEPQECGGAGVCVDPSFPSGQTNQARVEEEAPKPPGPMLAALEEKEKRPAAAPGPAAEAAPNDVAACRRSCDEVRNQCIEAITGETNKCLSAIRSEAGYRQCSCPNYPAGNTGCYNFCANAYEKGKSCAADALVHDCKTDGDRCRAQCK
jgi:hypothetical protein